MNSTRILIFDSGVGGLSVLQAVQQKLPQCQYTYACDNEAFPYGTKAEDALIRRVDRVLQALVRDVCPDIIVIACNTASTVALPQIRANFSIPVVGVVPAIKPAASISKTGVIGLLGTPGTVARQYTAELINDFASHCQVIRVGSSELVEVAEQKLRGQKPDSKQLSTILSPFFASDQLDCIILACTHFPLLANELQSAAPRSVTWVDSGTAIARRVESLLQPIEPVSAKPPTFSAILTCEHDQITVLTENLKSMGCDELRIISVGS